MQDYPQGNVPQPNYTSQQGYTPYMQQGYAQPIPPPQPAPKKPKRWPWIVAIVAALMVGYAVGSVGHSSTTPTTTNTTQATTASAQPTTAPVQASTHHKLNDVVSVEDTWQVTVTSAKSSPGDGSLNVPKAGNQYLVIGVTLKNISAQSQNASGLIQFSLRDQSGTKYDEVITYATDPGGKVSPGDPLKGTLAYQVPLSTKKFVLNFEASIVSTDQQSWDITI